jgi:hypothetical protein
MASELLVFSTFANDAEGVLATVKRFAPVAVELILKISCCLSDAGKSVAGGLELLAAKCADGNNWNASNAFHYPNGTLWHNRSLAHSEKGT